MNINFESTDNLELGENKSDESSTESQNGWSDDIETLLKDMEYNSGILSQIHKANYLALHEYIKYFKDTIYSFWFEI